MNPWAGSLLKLHFKLWAGSAEILKHVWLFMLKGLLYSDVVEHEVTQFGLQRPFGRNCLA